MLGAFEELEFVNSGKAPTDQILTPLEGARHREQNGGRDLHPMRRQPSYKPSTECFCSRRPLNHHPSIPTLKIPQYLM
ncbi:hypothetical protein SprV_0200718500 [Sparganum proliferum]